MAEKHVAIFNASNNVLDSSLCWDSAYGLYPKTNYVSYLGGSANRWLGVYSSDINTATLTISGAINGEVAWKKVYIDGSLNSKASVTSLNLKADQIYVDGSLATTNANVSTINSVLIATEASLNLKTDKTYVDTQDASNFNYLNTKKLESISNTISYFPIWNSSNNLGNSGIYYTTDNYGGHILPGIKFKIDPSTLDASGIWLGTQTNPFATIYTNAIYAGTWIYADEFMFNGTNRMINWLGNGTYYLQFTDNGAGLGTIIPYGCNLSLGTTLNPFNYLYTINADVSVLTVHSNPPSSSTASGKTGTITWDNNYLYVCTSTNTWKRAALSTW